MKKENYGSLKIKELEIDNFQFCKDYFLLFLNIRGIFEYRQGRCQVINIFQVRMCYNNLCIQCLRFWCLIGNDLPQYSQTIIRLLLIPLLKNYVNYCHFFVNISLIKWFIFTYPFKCPYPITSCFRLRFHLTSCFNKLN